jgi:replicative DNA helicase
MQLSEDFIVEFFKTCITTKSILELGLLHIKDNYLPTDSHKKIWKNIVHVFELSETMPTVGILSERLKGDQEAESLLVKIKNCRVDGKKDIIVDQLESFLKEMKFKELYKKTGKLFNEDKQDEAIEIMAMESESIHSFSFRKDLYSTVFDQFEERQVERKKNVNEIDKTKVPTGIHPLDHYTRGGLSAGTSALFLGRSGAGKSTLLRWIGLHASRLGYRVAHFQAEGTEREAFDAYDAAWTSVDLEDMELGNIPVNKANTIKKVRADILGKKGEIYVVASEKFDNMAIDNCREDIIELEKVHGKIHLVLFDYLEIFTVRGKYFNSENSERKRREDIANKITNIATEFKCATATATQANDIKPDKWNNPDYVMTRSDISEFKGALKPFSYFVTLNQTTDEYEAGVMRMFNDKFRKYKAGQTFRIYQSMKNSRFYDSKRSLEAFWDEQSNKPRK